MAKTTKTRKVSKPRKLISWRCRGCGELQDVDAPTTPAPRCGSCGASMMPFDPPPEPIEIEAPRRRDAGQPVVERPSSLIMAMQGAVGKFAIRLENLENANRNLTPVQAVLRVVQLGSDRQLDELLRGIEGELARVGELAQTVRNEIDRRNRGLSDRPIKG